MDVKSRGRILSYIHVVYVEKKYWYKMSWNFGNICCVTWIKNRIIYLFKTNTNLLYQQSILFGDSTEQTSSCIHYLIVCLTEVCIIYVLLS